MALHDASLQVPHVSSIAACSKAEVAVCTTMDCAGACQQCLWHQCQFVYVLVNVAAALTVVGNMTQGPCFVLLACEACYARRRYNNPAVALNCGSMLRDCVRDENLAQCAGH